MLRTSGGMRKYRYIFFNFLFCSFLLAHYKLILSLYNDLFVGNTCSCNRGWCLNSKLWIYVSWGKRIPKKFIWWSGQPRRCPNFYNPNGFEDISASTSQKFHSAFPIYDRKNRAKKCRYSGKHIILNHIGDLVEVAKSISDTITSSIAVWKI